MAKRLKVALLIGSSRRYRRDLLCGIAAYARTHGPWSFFHQERALGDAAPVWLKDWQGDGIIAQIENRKLIRQIQQTGLPTVDLFGLHKIEGIPSVIMDSQAEIQMVADHFIERGFEHFAFYGLPGVHYSDRFGTHFEQYLARAGYDVSIYGRRQTPRAVTAVSVETRGLMHEDALATWIESLPKPLAIVACNDVCAQQVLTACGDHGIAVPDEVAVLGGDNDEVLCELSNPPLSSTDPNAKKMGYEAAALLERLIEGQEPPEEALLVRPLGVVVRQSTDVLAVADRAVAKAVRFIRESACDGIGVEDVCRHARLSRSTLERRFAKHLGRSPKAEILRVQLERIKQFLIETDYPMAKIAQLAGITHVENMCRYFKSKTGMTPGQYRKSSRMQ